MRWFCLFCLLGYGLLAPGLHAAPVVLVYGDSLSAAHGIDSRASWVSLLQQRLQARGYPHRVVNASISGETSAGGRQRIARTLATHQPAVLILELGANDGLRGLDPGPLHDNLDAIIRSAIAARARVLLVAMRLPPNYGKTYTQQFHENYVKLARQHRLPPPPFLLDGMAERLELFLPDRIHPNAQAQPLLLDNVWKSLEPLLQK